MTDMFTSDDNAFYYAEYTYNTSDIESVVANPHFSKNRALARERRVRRIDWAYFGSCMEG